MQELRDTLRQACKDLFGVDVDPELERPDEQFGDFATNVALQLTGKLGKPPREIAEKLVQELQKLPMIAEAKVVSPGFVNVRLTDEYLLNFIGGVEAGYGRTKKLEGQVIVLEHTDPNPFKEFHIGHAYSNTVGVAIGKLFANAGAEVHQVSYHGDVGLHIAMAVWAMGEEIDWQTEGLDPESMRQRLGISIGHYYAKGAKAYRDNAINKARIEEINQHLYAHDDPALDAIYDAGRQWSLGVFDEVYQQLGSHFEKQYFESETAVEGMEIVKKHVSTVFEESEGAIVYRGEKAGLHTRVFITKRGLPTYETKEIGLAFAKQRDYPGAQSFVVITANEIDEYFKVLVAAIKEIDPGLAAKIRHLSHGVVKLSNGKMSSRTGQVVTYAALEGGLGESIRKLYGEGKDSPEIVTGALKYEFLKHRLGGDITFDIEESVSLHGNSGPYLQYAYARACSILSKVHSEGLVPGMDGLEESERSLVRKISIFPDEIQKATDELMPHYIAAYLYELAQNFNRFYEKNRIIGDEREALRLRLVNAYQRVLKKGLDLLNISAPEKI